MIPLPTPGQTQAVTIHAGCRTFVASGTIIASTYRSDDEAVILVLVPRSRYHGAIRNVTYAVGHVDLTGQRFTAWTDNCHNIHEAAELYRQEGGE